MSLERRQTAQGCLHDRDPPCSGSVQRDETVCFVHFAASSFCLSTFLPPVGDGIVLLRMRF